jgi:hypothetical protein
MVLRDCRQALHAGMEKRYLRAHGAISCCRKADKTAPTRMEGRGKTSVCGQCDVIKPLSVSAYSQEEKICSGKTSLSAQSMGISRFRAKPCGAGSSR